MFNRNTGAFPLSIDNNQFTRRTLVGAATGGGVAADEPQRSREAGAATGGSRGCGELSHVDGRGGGRVAGPARPHGPVLGHFHGEHDRRRRIGLAHLGRASEGTRNT